MNEGKPPDQLMAESIEPPVQVAVSSKQESASQDSNTILMPHYGDNNADYSVSCESLYVTSNIDVGNIHESKPVESELSPHLIPAINPHVSDEPSQDVTSAVFTNTTQQA
jgi:hypothetical protein